MHKCISNLAKVGLIAKVKNARCKPILAHSNDSLDSHTSTDDGYRLTYGGLDYLALNAHRRSNTVFSLGNQIGVGKESDIYITAAPDSTLQVLKIHRLGRISFRSVKSKRDYLRNRSTGSWMYLSRLAAQKEFEVMKVLKREGFAVPQPVSWNRHTIVMEFIDAFPLRMIESIPEPGKLYAELMDTIVQLAARGLIHGDYNEFNILIKEIPQPDGSIQLAAVLIDFPQAVSTNHANAEMYFDRDVACVKRYFERRFKYTSDEPGPFFKDAVKDIDAGRRLDVEVEASGFSKKMARDLERYVEVADNRDGAEGQGEPGHGAEEEEGGEQADEDDEEEGEDGNEAETEELARNDEDGEGAVSDELAALSIHEPKRRTAASYGLLPLEMPTGHDEVAEKMHKQKAAAGWAI